MSVPPASSNPGDSYRAGLVDLAIKDLASRLKAPVSQIEMLRFETVTWPDSSLGCPQPDMLYSQAQVEGYCIRLRHNGKVYEYHGCEDRAPFFCETPS